MDAPRLFADYTLPSSPSCRLMAPSGAAALSKIVARKPRKYVQVTIKRRMTVIRLEKSKMADWWVWVWVGWVGRKEWMSGVVTDVP